MPKSGEERPYDWRPRTWNLEEEKTSVLAECQGNVGQRSNYHVEGSKCVGWSVEHQGEFGKA